MHTFCISFFSLNYLQFLVQFLVQALVLLEQFLESQFLESHDLHVLSSLEASTLLLLAVDFLDSFLPNLEFFPSIVYLLFASLTC